MPNSSTGPSGRRPLVHDDEVEEVLWELVEEAFAALVLGEGLVDSEVNLAAIIDDAVLDLPSGIAEDGKNPVLGVIDEDIAVCEV